MAVVGHQRAAKNSRAQWNGTNLVFADWNLTRQGADLPTNNFEAAGEDQGTIGFNSTQWDLAGAWNAQYNTWDNPPGIYPRDDGGPLKLFLSTVDGTFHLMTLVRVLSAKNSAQCEQLVQYNCSGKSQGGFVAATGSF